jgi:GntR family transcriptional regulator, transcriptional repressor for pyruvate dehydrogenase complex
MFTKLRPRNLSDDVVDQIISAILTGKLNPGDRLPAERALSAMFGVARQVVREGLHKLEQMGLVQVRKPQGASVSFLSPAAIRQPMADLLAREIDAVTNFLNVRGWLEGMSAAQSAEHATERDLQEIEGTLGPLEAAAAQNDREALDQSDVVFHLAIVQATHDPMMMEVLDMFRSLMWSSHGCRTVILEATDFGAVCREHRAVANAIRARHPGEARGAMVHHIEMIRCRIERMYGQTRRGSSLPR